MLAWIADALPHTDYFLPNDEQVLGFTGALARGRRPALLEPAPGASRSPGCPGCAGGQRPDETIEVPAYDVEVVDTTGCGDAFSAGFLRGISLGKELGVAAALGCATAAQVAQGLGTDAGDYSLETVEDFAANASPLT